MIYGDTMEQFCAFTCDTVVMIYFIFQEHQTHPGCSWVARKSIALVWRCEEHHIPSPLMINRLSYLTCNISIHLQK